MQQNDKNVARTKVNQLNTARNRHVCETDEKKKSMKNDIVRLTNIATAFQKGERKMAIAMRISFTDVLRDGTLKNVYVNGKKMGYRFDVRLSYYRGHFLSVIDELTVSVDGEEVKPQDITFCLHGKEFGVSQLHEATTEFWGIKEPATIKIFREGGLEKGEHEIDFHLVFRSPYMPIGEQAFMPWDSSQCKILTVES